MITSTSNSQIKTIVQLNKKAKARRELRAFVVEGAKMVAETPGELLQSVYVAEHFLKDPENKAFFQANDFDYEIVSDAVFSHMSDTNTPQGILAVVRQPHYELEQLLEGRPVRLLILEDIQDPGNLGTMVRTAEGAGFSGIVMTKGTVDLFAPKTVRGTMGGIYRMPYVVTEDLPHVLEQLHAKGIKTFAAHLRGERFYDELDLTGDLAFLIGNEGNGLKEETAALADTYLKIPMEGRLESLNAAMAAGILMYETYRQGRMGDT